VFDMDGVMVDSEATSERANLECFGELGLTVPADLHVSMLGRRVRDMTDAVAALNGVDPDELFARREEVFWRLVGERGLEPMPGVRETVARLATARVPERLRLAVASSGRPRYIAYVLDLLGVREAFEVVVSGEDVTLSKPHPQIYLKTAAALGVPPQHCVALEDAPHGVRSAAAAGMRVVAIPAGMSLNGDFAQAEKVVRSLPEAADYLLGEQHP
jgi:HAD superfamily hydrolase (TIGR01509 family)